jgi:uncharacterized SAM-binding protein YcdF (DUF218 family)
MARLMFARKKKPSVAARLGLALLLVLAVFMASFWHFTRQMTPTPALPDITTGLVVFTGGSNRVITCADLLKRGFEGPVLITGVYPGATKDELFDGQSVPPERMSQIHLDYDALTTLGNVRQTRAWARQNGIRDVVLVTSTYHVPRSLALFRREAPELAVRVYPVFPEKVSWNLWFTEFSKYLAVGLGF